MSTTPNWSKLVSEGRVKAIGVPWTPEEKAAAFVLRIPPDYIRRGILTREDYEEELAKEKKLLAKGKDLPVESQTLEQLRKLAKKLKVEFTPEATRDILIREIIRAQKALEEAEAAEKAKAEAKAKAKAEKAAAKAGKSNKAK